MMVCTCQSSDVVQFFGREWPVSLEWAHLPKESTSHVPADSVPKISLPSCKSGTSLDLSSQCLPQVKSVAPTVLKAAAAAAKTAPLTTPSVQEEVEFDPFPEEHTDDALEQACG